MAAPVTVVDQSGRELVPLTGRDDPFGRSRKVQTLRLRDGPVVVAPSVWLAGPGGEIVVNHVLGTIVGTPGVVVHRLASASRVTDTRLL
jgi:hypothetical protein